ncbi:MAG: hypothetical protein WC700_21000 [Gemmatimonadaceae bacterium]|jgi:hypothetical protein
MIQPILLLLATAALHVDPPTKPVAATFPSTVRAALLRPDTTARTSLMHRDAARRMAKGDLNGARIVYRTIIAYEDSVGVFPGESIWTLATLEFGRGRELRAAELLDRVAESAVRYGRPDWQARALLEAGLLYQQHGRTDLSVVRYSTLLPLLESPAISAEDRAALKARIVRR